MIMSWIWTGILLFSLICATATGQITELATAIAQGAQTGFTLTLAIGGALCLWSGVGVLIEKAGITTYLCRLLFPVLKVPFPSVRQDPILGNHLSGNICANILGLGNAATPMGVAAAKRLAARSSNGTASDELCRLIVLNTASIQLIPSNVAAVRAQAGAVAPFDILPAVWITSICSAGLGLTAAWLFGRVWRHD